MSGPRRVVEEPGRLPPAVLAVTAVLLLVLLAWRVVEAYRAGEIQTVGRAPRAAAPASAAAAAPPAPVAPRTPASAATPAPPAPASATQPPAPPPPRPAAVTLPYRYVGSTGTGPQAELVFFGRGRTVTLQGPGPLDDEYVIESVLDGRVQWRHLPSGTSQFMDLSARPSAAPGPATRPEDSPRD